MLRHSKLAIAATVTLAAAAIAAQQSEPSTAQRKAMLARHAKMQLRGAKGTAKLAAMKNLPRAQFEAIQDLHHLRGLGGVRVWVAPIDEQAEQAGLDRAAIQQVVEQQLRTAGVRTLSGKECLNTPGMPYLTVSIEAQEAGGGLFIYALAVQLMERATPDRDKDLWLGAVTWESRTLGTVGRNKLPALANVAQIHVANFIEALNLSNPGDHTASASPARSRS